MSTTGHITAVRVRLALRGSGIGTADRYGHRVKGKRAEHSCVLDERPRHRGLGIQTLKRRGGSTLGQWKRTIGMRKLLLRVPGGALPASAMTPSNMDPRPRPSAAGPVSGISTGSGMIRSPAWSARRRTRRPNRPLLRRCRWRSMPSRTGIAGWERPEGLGGRSRPCPCGQCATGDRAARSHDVVAPADITRASVRIAGWPKCASDPHVVCAVQYGCKSRAAHRLARPGEAARPAHVAHRDSELFHSARVAAQDAAAGAVAGGDSVNRRRLEL